MQTAAHAGVAGLPRAYVRDEGGSCQPMPIAAFYLSASDGSDNVVCASPTETMGSVMARLFPDGMRSDGDTVMLLITPSVEIDML